MTDGPIIELKGITKTFGQGPAAFQALKGVDLTIERGDFVAIMGPSGSGKSTLMNLLGCLDVPTRGRYRLAGEDVARLRAEQLAAVRNRQLGFVFQGFNLLQRNSVEDNVALPLVYAGIKRAERRARARTLLDRVGLGSYAASLPARISGGQQQRVAIARALVNRPRVLLADEPTGNLDSHTSDEIMALFAQLNAQEGLTIVVVTHEADVAAVASRVVVFRDGHKVEDRTQVPRVPEGVA